MTRPKRIVLTVVVWTAIVLALGLVPTCASMGVFPAATRVAAPLVCAADSHSEVVARWGGSSRGGRSLKWDLYCLDSNGHGSMPSTPKLFFALLFVWCGIAGAFIGGRHLLRRVRRSGGADAA